MRQRRGAPRSRCVQTLAQQRPVVGSLWCSQADLCQCWADRLHGGGGWDEFYRMPDNDGTSSRPGAATFFLAGRTDIAPCEIWGSPLHTHTHTTHTQAAPPLASPPPVHPFSILGCSVLATYLHLHLQAVVAAPPVDGPTPASLNMRLRPHSFSSLCMFSTLWSGSSPIGR